jgi:hypothetical protein
MAEKEKQEIELHVKEEKDGSAVVALPEGIDMGDELDDEFTPLEPKSEADGGSVEEEEPDHPDDSDAVREAKRNRRRSKRALARDTTRERELQLQQLKRQNEEMSKRMAELERKSQYSEMSQLDKQIEDENLRLEYAKMKISEAAAAGDGEAMVQAQEMMYDSKEKLSSLSGVKNNFTRQPQTPKQEQIDPRMQMQASKWIERNTWYKPNLTDTDSRIAKSVDEELVKEGWNPNEADYWDELDSRLQKYLPHRYNASAERSSSDRKPRNVVGSSGREASASFGGSNRTFTLSPQQVNAIKEAGMWDNVESRNRMIRRYAQQSRNMEGRQS